jgi:hypothetical protein
MCTQRYTMHNAVRILAEFDAFNPDTEGYMPVSQAPKDSSAAKTFSIGQLAGNCRLFATTVKIAARSGGSSYLSDGSQRPCFPRADDQNAVNDVRPIIALPAPW